LAYRQRLIAAAPGMRAARIPSASRIPDDPARHQLGQPGQHYLLAFC